MLQSWLNDDFKANDSTMAINEVDEVATVELDEASLTASASASDALILLSSRLLTIESGSFLPLFAWN